MLALAFYTYYINHDVKGEVIQQVKGLPACMHVEGRSAPASFSSGLASSLIGGSGGGR